MEPTANQSREQISARIVEALVEFGSDREKLRPEATLKELDIDSLDLFELGQILHEEFGLEVDAEDFQDVTTLGKAYEVLLDQVE